MAEILADLDELPLADSALEEERLATLSAEIGTLSLASSTILRKNASSSFW